MTHLELPPDVEQLREVVRTFARTRLGPAAEGAERASAIPAQIVRSFDELGLLAPLEPADDQALDPVAMAVVAEEIAIGDPGVAYEVISGVNAALLVSALGNPEHLAAARGSAEPARAPLGSLWLYEGFGRGSDEYDTEFIEVDGRLELNGRKIGVVRPGTADFVVVVGRSAGRSAAVLLDRATARAVTITRDDHETGKLGLTAAHTGDVRFAGVRVPAGALLVDDVSELDRWVASARLSTAAIAVGAGTAALAYAAEYATSRQAFGQPISAYQGVAFPLAEAEMELKGARWAILDLALRLGNKSGIADLHREAGEVVAAAVRAATAATVTGINTLGGHGFLTDHPVERWYRAVGTLAALDSDPLLLVQT